MRRLLSALLAVLTLAACSGVSQTPGGTTPTVPVANTPTPAAGTVTISFAAYDYEAETYRALAAKFSAEHPGITVVIVPLDDLLTSPNNPGPESSTAGLRRVVAGADTAPGYFVQPEAFDSALLLDLTPLMDADANFKRDDFYPGALERTATKGGQWVLPRSFYVQLLSYNSDLFKLANLPEPKIGTTWADLLATSEQIAGSASGTYGMLDVSSGLLPLLTFVKGQGGDPLAASPSDLRPDDPAIVKGLEQMRVWAKNRTLLFPYSFGDTPVKDRGGQNGQNNYDLVINGQLGMWVDNALQQERGGMPDLSSIPVKHIPYPNDVLDLFGYQPADGYIISGGTAHPNESWTWIEWLSRQSIDTPGAQPDPNRIPARVSVAEASDFWKKLDKQTADSYRWTIANGKSTQAQFDYQVPSALSQAIGAVLGDPKTDVKKALADAVRSMNESIAQNQTTPTPTPDLNPVLVATPEPQQAADGATTIVFNIGSGSATDLRRLVRAFREQHPEIFVQLKTITYTEISPDASPNTTPAGPTFSSIANESDCFGWGSLPTSAEDFAALLDVQPLLDADATLPQGEFSPALLGAYQRDGKLYGLPLAFSMRTLNANRTALDESGAAAPKAAWKPADFLASAQALTSGEGDKRRWGYVALGGVQNDMFFFIGQFGGRLTSGSGKDLRASFTDPKTVAAIRWYLDLATVHKVTPPLALLYRRDDTTTVDNSYDLVNANRAGMWFDYGFGAYSRENNGGTPPPVDVVVGPLPVGGGGVHGSDLSTRGFYISAKTQHAPQCYEWIKFLTADTTQIYSGETPARASVVASDAYTAPLSGEQKQLIAVYNEVLKQPGTQGDDPTLFYSGAIDPYWLWKAIDETSKTKGDLAKALADAEKPTNAFIACVAGGGKAPDCALQADPDYKGYNYEDPNGGSPGA